MKVSNMTNEQLDHWVAKAQGWKYRDLSNPLWLGEMPNGGIEASDYSPTTNWEQCGELIEKYQIGLIVPETHWVAELFKTGKPKVYAEAQNPRTAICRAVVASVFGEEVSE